MHFLNRMVGRDPSEGHRQATMLEIFFDLTFVVAIAQCALSLHHGLSEGHVREALINYPMVFFAIWWAWMNFTWFASAYATDDIAYRLAVFVQMAGVLVLAAGVPRAFDERDFLIITVGYGILRVGQLAQWARVAIQDPASRGVAIRSATLIGLVQIGWFLRLLLDDTAALIGFLVLVAAEISVPYLAERAGRTNWHSGHIAERYGLFTIIVLGESILASTIAIQSAIDAHNVGADLLLLAVGGLLIAFTLWWVYFDQPTTAVVDRLRRSGRTNGNPLVWAYGHCLIFLSVAAVGAGIPALVDVGLDHSQLTETQAALTLTIPVAVFLLAVWGVHICGKPKDLAHIAIVPIAAIGILLTSLLPESPLFAGAILVMVIIAMSRTTSSATSAADVTN